MEYYSPYCTLHSQDLIRHWKFHLLTIFTRFAHLCPPTSGHHQSVVSLSLFFFFWITYIIYMWDHKVFVFSDLLHLAHCPWSPSMLLEILPLLKHGGKQISLWLKNISLWIYVAYSFIHSLVGRPLDNLSVLDQF